MRFRGSDRYLPVTTAPLIEVAESGGRLIMTLRLRSRVYLLCVLSSLCLAIVANAQTTTIPSTDSLIEHSLSYVDYPMFVRQEAAPPMRPRLGIYMNNFPADSVRLLTRGADTIKRHRIWHVAPHWSADNAGLMMGDTRTSIPIRNPSVTRQVARSCDTDVQWFCNSRLNN